MDLVWRALDAQDVEAWSQLTDIVATADDTSERYSAEDLAEELEDPSLDIELDTLAVFADNALVAVGQVHQPLQRVDGAVRSTFGGTVHPQFRGQGIGAELLDRLEARATELTLERYPQAQVRPATQAPAHVPDAVALLESRGYRPVRYFTEMTHDLEDLDESTDLSGLADYRADLDREVHDAHREAFAEHWGSAPPSDERWAVHYTGSRTFRPACSTVALGPDDTVPGYILSYEFQPRELWFGQVGVRASARRQGLAKRMLARSLLVARAAGYETVCLDVDSDNADGATGLYESVGFRSVRTVVVYQKD